MRLTSITFQIVEFAPAQLEPSVLYISEKYATALHLCCCGCGQEVVTPLSSAEWQLRRIGNTVSLYPSIGNWSFACQSHYWIKQNKILWAGAMSAVQIDRVRQRDKRDKDRQIHKSNATKLRHSSTTSVWKIIRAWFKR